MTYATIMVNLALDRSNEACIAVAQGLAERFNARVIGVAAAEFSPPLYFTSGEMAQKLIDGGEALIEARLVELETKFRAAMGRSNEIEWRCALDMPARFIARQARAADIIVTESDSNTLTDPFASANADDLVMQAGRPILIVPDTVRWLDLRHCLIGWKDTPEARRAVVDALPMLSKTREVTVAEIVEDDRSKAAAVARVNDVVAWLGHHGIFATGLVPDETGDTAIQLEQVASNIGANVVVAGAYGHSRFKEWVFGGVTRSLLQQSDRCSFVSH
jgi:nucleotide-binding universal stress UspA family protein